MSLVNFWAVQGRNQEIDRGEGILLDAQFLEFGLGGDSIFIPAAGFIVFIQHLIQIGLADQFTPGSAGFYGLGHQA